MNPHAIGTFAHHHCGFRRVSVAETNRVRALIVLHSSQEGFFLSQKASPTQTGAVPEKGPRLTVDRLVTVQELCEILGVSKSRLYSLIRDGILPQPKRNPSNNRPVFDSELTESCRQVFKTHIGVNGQPYTPNRKRGTGNRTVPRRGRHESLIASLSALGLTATAKQVDDAVKSLPDAEKGIEEEELVKRVFLILHQSR